MSIRFQPTKFGLGAPAPNTQGYTPDAALTCLRGAPMTYVPGGDDVIEHVGGATVTLILGVAAHDVSVAGTSDDVSGNVLVHKASNQEFAGSVLASAAVVTDLSGISIGDEYGFIKHSDNEWYVDFDDTTNVVLTITKIDDNLNIVWFRFLASAVQEL